MSSMNLKRKKIKSAAFIDSSEDSDSSMEEQPKVDNKKVKKSKASPKSEEANAVDDSMHELSSKRYVNVKAFRNNVLIDIREYYTDASGELKPSKKGISLTIQQWNKLLSLQKAVNEDISKCQ